MADLNQLAARLVQQATDPSESTRESAKARAGHAGGKRGGRHEGEAIAREALRDR